MTQPSIQWIPIQHRQCTRYVTQAQCSVSLPKVFGWSPQSVWMALTFLSPLAPCRYGITEEEIHPILKGEMADFRDWETSHIQLDRPAPYAKGVQVVTSLSHRGLIRTFAGFSSTCFGRPTLTLSLGIYQEPTLFLAFISFLMVRNDGCWVSSARLGAPGYPYRSYRSIVFILCIALLLMLPSFYFHPSLYRRGSQPEHTSPTTSPWPSR